MGFVESLVWLSVVVLSILVIVVVLMQPSKDAGSSSYSFSGFVGSSGVLGVSSAGNFMTKFTSWVVFLLFVACMGFAFLSRSVPVDLGSPVTEESVERGAPVSKEGASPERIPD